MQRGDIVVVLLLLAILSIFLVWRFRRALEEPPRRYFPIPTGEPIEQDEVVELLEGAGFDVLASKVKVPIKIAINDVESFDSRLYIDYFAEKNDEVFVVRVSRERKVMEMTGSSVRDTLLQYQLLYPEAAGVLYVDLQQQKIKKINFLIEV